MTLSWRQQPSYNIHLGMVINCAKFEARSSSSFEGVKTHTHAKTELRFVV